MARQITILETTKASDGVTTIRCVFWYPIANVNARVPRPQFVSALVDVPAPNNVTPTEQADLESGAVREEVLSVTSPVSATLAQVKGTLVLRYTDRAAAVAAEPATRAFYGVSYNGSAWTN